MLWQRKAYPLDHKTQADWKEPESLLSQALFQKEAKCGRAGSTGSSYSTDPRTEQIDPRCDHH